MGARETALNALIACRKEGAWSNGVMKEYIVRDRLDSRDAGLATRLCEGSGKPGEILGLTKTGLRIACGEGAVEVIQLQAEGGKRMAAPDYFRGHPLD